MPTSDRGGPIALRLCGVERRFGGVVAVQGVDMNIPAGERRVILGPNGAGKTTLFNVISGELPASDGTIELFGRDVTQLPTRRRAKLGLSRTFQISRLFLGLTVEDNLYLATVGTRGYYLLPLRGLSRDEELRERAREVAKTVGLHEKLAAVVGSLSHGEQRQLEVGIAQAARPRLMMLDEPAAGLSQAERSSLTHLLLSLDPAITLILIEHDVDLALGVADRVTVMHQGRIIAEGRPEEIRQDSTVQDIYLGAAITSG